MAPYISSHLHDGVWMAPLLPGAHLDILQNLVANTRKPQSATFMCGQQSMPCLTGGGWRPAAAKTSAWKWQHVHGWLRLVPSGQLRWRSGGFSLSTAWSQELL